MQAHEGAEIARRERLLAALLAGGSGTVLLLARLLTPDLRGVGTHTQLGLPPCFFLTLFGKPCPACGLTTAFAHLAQGSLVHSLHAHPLGVPLFVATLALWVLSTGALLRGEALGPRLQAPSTVRLALVLSLGLLVVWLVRFVV